MYIAYIIGDEIHENVELKQKLRVKFKVKDPQKMSYFWECK